MIGNAMEWVADCETASLADKPADGSPAVADANCRKRMMRGGGWRFRDRDNRVARRLATWAQDRFNYSGFRVGKSIR